MIDQSGLIDLRTRSKAERIAIARKGGQTTSPQRSESQKLRFIRERLQKQNNLSDEDFGWLMQRIESRTSASAELLTFFEALKKEAHNFDDKIKINQLYLNALRFIHGERNKLDVETKNINLETTVEEVREHLNRVLGKKEEKNNDEQTKNYE
jgi:hypothetical protein